MRVLQAASELHPFSKTGGLADMAGALAKYLAVDGHEVTVITPLYGNMRDRFPEIKATDISFALPLGELVVTAKLWRLSAAKRLTIYFVDQPEFYQRPALYGNKTGDYTDNAERFVFFSKCVVELARHLPRPTEIIHAHDWQAGLVPLFVRHARQAGDWLKAPRTCLTIHNLAYQGVFPSWKFPLTNLPSSHFTPAGVEFFGWMNCLKAGLVYADMLTTVSPRYAREITTEEFGCALDGVLRERQHDLTGVLNGVDYEEWNTTHNPFLLQPYSQESLEGKATAKVALQQEFGLPQSANVPLFGVVSRLADQKGVDILTGALEEMLGADIQFVLLGSGQAEFERAVRSLAVRHPTKASVKIGYDHALSHRIEAGVDFFLMPSHFEPCGLNQMYSLRYGSVPVVRATGGLDDSIVDVTEDVDSANGIKFYEYSSRALAKAIRKAIVLFGAKELFGRYRLNGMSSDFSWKRTTTAYEEIYKRALAR